MQSLILTLHIIVCVLLVILILLQSGKEGMGVIFGGGNTSVFGSTGAGGILPKLTTLMAIIFVITSLSYTYVSSSRPTTESVILDVKIEDPVAPAPAGQSGNAAQPQTVTPPADQAKPDAAPAEQKSDDAAQPAQKSEDATAPAQAGETTGQQPGTAPGSEPATPQQNQNEATAPAQTAPEPADGTAKESGAAETSDQQPAQ